MLANSLQALRQERRSSLSIKDSMAATFSQARRRSLPLPDQVCSRRGSLTFKNAAGLMINVQKFTLKSGRFVNEPGKILAHPRQGMVEDHFNIIRDISRLLMQPIFFRMVNPENKGLVPLLFPSKDLSIKPKSADWNWGCGFLPEDPMYSKLTATPEKIEAAREDIQKLYRNHPGHACGQQLMLTTERMKKLLEKAEPFVSHENHRVEVIFEQDGIQARQIARYDSDNDRWAIHNADGTPFNVIAHPEYGPYIADYDLLMTAVPMSHFYLQPDFDERYGLMIEERFVIVDEEEILQQRTQTIIADDEYSAFEPNTSHSVDINGQSIVTRKTIQRPRKIRPEPAL